MKTSETLSVILPALLSAQKELGGIYNDLWRCGVGS